VRGHEVLSRQNPAKSRKLESREAGFDVRIECTVPF
jgi:hypothetical protein